MRQNMPAPQRAGSTFGRKTLKTLIWIVAIVHLLSFAMMFLPWSCFEAITEPFGVENIPDSPMIVYSFRVMMACMGIIGLLLIPMALDPKKYKTMIQLIGIAGILIAVFMFVLSTFVYKFGNYWYYADPLFALIFGVGFLWLTKKT